MAKQKEAWDKLSMLEKALLIKLSIDNGVSSLKLIRDTYNLYADGGNLAHKYDGELVGLSLELNNNYTIPTVNKDLFDPTKQIIHDFSKSNSYDFTSMQEQYKNNYINLMYTDNLKVILDALASDKRLLKAYNKANIQGDAASFNSWVYELTPSKRRRLENTIGFPYNLSGTTVTLYGILSPSSILGLKDIGDVYDSTLLDTNYTHKVDSHNKKSRNALNKYVDNQTYLHIINLLQPQLLNTYNVEHNPYVAYLQLYFNSDVYKLRAHNNHVLPTTFVYNPFIETSKSFNAIGDNNAVITLGTLGYIPTIFNNIASHELGHSAFYGYADDSLIDPHAINILTNSLPEGVTYDNDHDASFNENYSDLLNTRASLYNNNIYDSTTGGIFTKEMLDAYRQTEDGKNNRFLKYHTDLAIIDAINNIAYNTTNPFEVSNGTYLAALGGPLNHKKSGEELGEGQELNTKTYKEKKESSAYPMYYNVLSLSLGDTDLVGSVARALIHKNAEDPNIYTGSYYFGDKWGYGTSLELPQNRNLISLYLDGDTTGFKQFKGKPIVLDGDTLTQTLYEGTLLPLDTIYLRPESKTTIARMAKDKDLLKINNSFPGWMSYSSKYNFLDSPYFLDKYEGKVMDDANNLNISFKQNSDGSYYADIFDLWDLTGTGGYKAGARLEKKLAEDSIENNGPFILRLHIPIVFNRDSVSDGRFLDAISVGQWQKEIDDTNKKSTGGPLYPFSFEKNPFLKTPIVRY